MRVAFRLTPVRTKLLVALAFIVMSLPARASVLCPGCSVPSSPLIPGGTLLAAVSGTITTVPFTVSYMEWVYADPLNTWCTNCLDFVYQFANSGPGSLQRFSMYSFAGVSADVGTDPYGVHDPVSIDRDLTGATIGFNYPTSSSDEIQPGQTTPLLVIETDAMAYTSSGSIAVARVFGEVAVQGYEPVVAPEPSSLGLMAGGLLVVGRFLRRFRPGR